MTRTCVACNGEIAVGEIAFNGQGTVTGGQWEHLACAAGRYSCASCNERFDLAEYPPILEPAALGDDMPFCSPDCQEELHAADVL